MIVLCVLYSADVLDSFLRRSSKMLSRRLLKQHAQPEKHVLAEKRKIFSFKN